jgi:hypothetical protein
VKSHWSFFFQSQDISWGLYLFVSRVLGPPLPLWRKQTCKLLVSPELGSQAPGASGLTFAVNIKLEDSRVEVPSLVSAETFRERAWSPWGCQLR